jgi:hypothetical protein
MEIVPFGALKMDIFYLWGWEWEKTPRVDFGAGIGKETLVPADFPNSSIAWFFIYFIYLKILGIYFAIYYEIFWLWVLYDYLYFSIHYEMFWLWCFVWLLVVKCFCIFFLLWINYVVFVFFKRTWKIFVFFSLIKRKK